MKRIAAIVCTLFLLLTLTACYETTDSDSSEDFSYDAAYDDGYETGYDEGYNEGEQNVYDSFGYGDYAQMSNAIDKYEWVLANLVFIPEGSNTYHRLDCELAYDQRVAVMFFDSANSEGYQPCGQCSYYE